MSWPIPRHRVTVRSLRIWCAAAASVGALLWIYKGVAILLTGSQPDHVFEFAPVFFGVSATALVYSLASQLHRPAWLLMSLGWVSVIAGGTAAVAHLLQQDDSLGDPAYLAHFLSTLILLFLIGGDIRRKHLLSMWSSAPTFLAWTMLLFIPVGAMLEAIDDRLLEVPLLAVSIGWAAIAAAALSRPSSIQP